MGEILSSVQSWQWIVAGGLVAWFAIQNRSSLFGLFTKAKASVTESSTADANEIVAAYQLLAAHLDEATAKAVRLQIADRLLDVAPPSVPSTSATASWSDITGALSQLQSLLEAKPTEAKS